MSFRFKQFFIEDSKCAMKVGTDGVLLGAWCPISNFKFQISNFRILDVGTGSGLIALMLAQRCPNAQIDAIDIDEAAVEQARENAQISNFKFQISNFVSSLQEWGVSKYYLDAIDEIKYDLIVSNPPYFQNSLKNPDKGREMARHTDTLSYEELVKHSARLLREGGQLALILPAEAETEIREIAAHYSLYCTHATRVFSKETKPARRVLLLFEMSRFRDDEMTSDSLVLEDEKGGRSLPYQELCKEFYL